ncbi:MAG: hypothetical protein ABSG17_23310 [Spirochaetia bacterium]|jgi:hypothetical protein
MVLLARVMSSVQRGLRKPEPVLSPAQATAVLTKIWSKIQERHPLKLPVPQHVGLADAIAEKIITDAEDAASQLIERILRL